MKILHVSAFPPDHPYGLGIFLKTLTDNLKVHNIESEVLSTNLYKHKSTIEYINGIKVYKQKSIKTLWGINPITNVLKFLIKNYKRYDIIHAHSYIFFSSLQAAFFRRFCNLPLIIHLHGGVQTQNTKPENIDMRMKLLFKHTFFDNILGNICLNLADAIISVSKQDLELISKIFHVKRNNNTYYIPNAVDINHFIPKNTNYNYISFIGRLTKIKGLDIFLKICSKLHEKNKELKFLIIGNGELRNEVFKYKKKLPIKFLSAVSHSDIPKYLNQTSILVNSSRFEGSSTTLLEAASVGIPIVASNVGGNSEIVNHDKNGYLFDNEDIETAVSSILKIYENNSFKKFGTTSRKIITKNYSWELITNQIIKVYNSLIE